jgi:hypothetical protein
VSEHEAQHSSLLPPAPAVAASVPTQDTDASLALLGTVVDELAESVRDLRRSMSDENVDLRARIRDLEARLARVEASQQAAATAAPADAPNPKQAKRARREARRAAATEAGQPPPVKDVRAKIARQLKDEHRQRTTDEPV